MLCDRERLWFVLVPRASGRAAASCLAVRARVRSVSSGEKKSCEKTGAEPPNQRAAEAKKSPFQFASGA